MDDDARRGSPRAADEPVLAEQTSDDTDVGWGGPWPDEHAHGWGGARSDEEYLRERPPHWE